MLEPGALEARHVRLLTPGWWQGYPPRPAEGFAACLGAARVNRIPEGEDCRTPWERQADGELETLRARHDPAQRRQHAVARHHENGSRTMAGELSGRTAFVTGSGRGLGRVMAERLAEAGADVAIHASDRLGPAKYGEFADLDEVAGAIRRFGGRVPRSPATSAIRRRWRG